MQRLHRALGFKASTTGLLVRLPALRCYDPSFRLCSATFFSATTRTPPSSFPPRPDISRSLALEWPRLLSFTRSSTVLSRWYNAKKEVTSKARPATLKRQPASFHRGHPWKQYIERIPHNFIIWGILGLNVAIFIGWQYAQDRASKGDLSMLYSMAHNFLMSWRNIEEGRIWTIVTSCFSHSAAGHIFMNAFTFYFMAPPVLRLLGNTSFLLLYLGGGITCSVVSLLMNKAVRQREGSSHGASGAIYSVVTFFACVAPRTTFYFFAVVPVPAWALVTGLFVWDGLSALTDRKTTVDGAGHVGGMLAGAAYFLFKIRRW